MFLISVFDASSDPLQRSQKKKKNVAIVPFALCLPSPDPTTCMLRFQIQIS